MGIVTEPAAVLEEWFKGFTSNDLVSGIFALLLILFGTLPNRLSTSNENQTPKESCT